MTTAIEAAEELHSPKSNGEVEKQTFPRGAFHNNTFNSVSYSNRSFSRKRRSKVVNDMYLESKEAHRFVEDGSI